MYLVTNEGTIVPLYIYTVGHKKVPLLFLGSLWQMWIDFNNFSQLRFVINCSRRWNKLYRLSSNLLPHYLVKFEYLTVQLSYTNCQNDYFAQRQTLISVYHDKLARVFCLIDLFLAQLFFMNAVDVIWRKRNILPLVNACQSQYKTTSHRRIHWTRAIH